MSHYEIRAMSRAELDFAVEQAAREGWNPGLHDADAFHAADAGGFLVGLLDGRPIGCISAVSYAGGFGFLGFYIVLPEYRGQGYGIQLWHKAMERLAGHNVGLDGVVAQQDNYRKSGFRWAYANIRYEGMGGGARVTSVATPAAIRSLAAVPFADLAAYDRAFFPAPRAAFLQAWLALPDSHGYAWVEAGRVQGWGLIRRCRQGWKIGPLCADSSDIAEALYQALAAQAPGEPVYLDTPEVNPAALALAARHGMTKVFETARMYTGDFPELALDRLYGVTSFELG